jgi:hypothetical protein
MQTTIKHILDDALNGLFLTGDYIQLDTRTVLTVRPQGELVEAFMTYKGDIVHFYTIDNKAYTTYLFDQESDTSSLAEQLLLDLKHYAKRG